MIGNRTRVKVVKNKVAPPHKIAEFEIYYGQGISQESSIINLGLQMGILSKSGSWFYRGEERIAQGKENVRQYLIEHPDIAAELKEQIMNEFNLSGGGKTVAAATENEDVE